MQLVAYGAQDIYLTGNPQITFFKVVYRRHTNFSMETIEQTLNGTASSGATSNCTISRNGDLVYRMYVTSTTTGITDGATTLVDEAELEIGGQRIDRHYSEWMNVWNELSTPESKTIALKSMVGSLGISGSTGVLNLVQVPLQFWFCRNPGLALPLIALQYHEVKIKITWGSNGDSNCGINCDYIYLDTDERRRFAQVSHEYLIEQIQREDKSSSGTHKLNFNHPVKELIWTTSGLDSAVYGTANLKLNGHDRFALQNPEYFQLRQPYECHTSVPKQNLPAAAQHGFSSLSDLIGPIVPAVCEDRNNAVSASGKMEVLQLSTHVLNVVDGSLKNDPVINFADADTTSDTAENIGYLFFETDFTGTGGGTAFAALSVGDGVEVEVTGTKSVAQHATAAHTVKTSITSKTLSAGHAGTGTILQFKDLLIKPASGEVTTELTVNGIHKIHETVAHTSQLKKKINVYSFALKPEEHQPSGTCNFSRIDNAQLIFTTPAECTVYAVNYNVLRIMSGMGGLAYSN